MQASSQNQLAAYYMGIPVKRINSLIWALSAHRGDHCRRAALAGVAGRSAIGFLGIKAFAAAVIGGFGSLLGTVLGGLIVGDLRDAGRRATCRRASRRSSPI